ncbi:phenylacetic acid degradation operon negative regulatory protein PaaX [Paraneptunicella aestuarii]|uniref:phenylacetic acid degradation operon negative regulatory protein PaaX n=1 Tax=Paraneptunicella aestuarii TaxID=2831148 RepID=UPI001E38C8F7|nr:phenylacetic acid degradation operon negative regulatory protein PaaX [Paraneptunicella aestuarii]UAA37442.1 phenylacetic acid degradation operon negative regulatory protein PaaX [Paraneptunicella aestuarii]
MTVTIFGDVVSQHGSWIWLGSLIECMEPMGFNDRAVRTSAFRLVQNGWLDVKKIGRKSYYCFTEYAKAQYERVARRIYASEPPEWDNRWLLVLTNSVPDDKREELKKSLTWQGFNMLTTNLYAHPSSDRRSLDETLIEQKLSQEVAVFTASTDDPYSQEMIKGLVNVKWGVEELANFYQQFLDYFRELQVKTDLADLTEQECFIFRSVVIHNYRRIQLRDPDLPDELLPNGWVGYEAQDLVKRLYRSLTNRSLHYIERELFNAQGKLPAASSKFYTRFGGLSQ